MQPVSFSLKIDKSENWAIQAIPTDNAQQSLYNVVKSSRICKQGCDVP